MIPLEREINYIGCCYTQVLKDKIYCLNAHRGAANMRYLKLINHNKRAA